MMRLINVCLILFLVSCNNDSNKVFCDESKKICLKKIDKHKVRIELNDDRNHKNFSAIYVKSNSDLFKIDNSTKRIYIKSKEIYNYPVSIQIMDEKEDGIKVRLIKLISFSDFEEINLLKQRE